MRFGWVALIFSLSLDFASWAQCTLPTAADTSRCGSGTATLMVSGGTKALYNWYDQGSGGTYLGTGAAITSPLVSSTTDYFVAQFDTGGVTSAIALDGVDDYVAIRDFYYNDVTYSAMTVEAWVRTSDGGNQVIASYDRNRYWRLEINGNGAGTGQVGFDIMTDAGQLDFGSVARVDDGAWHHVAAVYDNGTVSIYIDGVLDNSTTRGSYFGDGSVAYGYWGVGSESSSFDGPKGPTDYFNGDLNDLRIWSVARTAAQISASRNQCLLGAQPGLEVYYRVNGTGATDTIVDYSTSNYHGELKNFTLPGAWINTGNTMYSCPTCESARDTATVSLKVVPTVNLGIDTCLSTALTLDAGAGKSAYLWNTGETTQTINVDSTGFYSVTVDSVGTSCQGSDGISVSLLIQPNGKDTSRCGPGTVDLQTTGSSATFYWYDQASGGTLLGSGATWTSTSITQTDTFYVAAVDLDTSDQALSFDGIDDYVALNMAYTTAGEINQLTLEAWVKTTVSGAGVNDNWSIIDFDRSDYYNLYVTGDNGRVGFSTADISTIDDFYTSTANTVNDGNWHHIAAVYDGTDKKIYIDGNLVATKSNPHGGLPLGKGTTRYGFLGDGSEATFGGGPRNNLFFQGELDEVRIWSDVRNLLEIQSNKDICLIGSEANLVAYYKMEDGSGTTLTDHTNHGYDGTLYNMAAGSWVNAGPAIDCSCGESNRDTVVVEVKVVPQVNLGNDTCALASFSLDAGPGMSAYSWNDGSSAQTLSASDSRAYWVAVDSAGTTCQGRDTIVVSIGKAAPPTVTDSSRCGNGTVDLIATGLGKIKWYDQSSGGSLLGTGDTLSVGPLSGDSTFYLAATLDNEKALSFDGVNDKVAIQSFNYNATSQAEMTVEAWVKLTSAGDHIVASFDRSEYWRLEINGDAAGPGQVGFGVNTDAGIIDLGSAGTVNDGAWHHIAAVYDNGTATVYIDGTADGSTSLGSTMGSDSVRFGFIGTGSEANSVNGITGPDYWFQGQIDEFRIWNVARSAADINTYKDSCLAGNEAGLQVYYRMSEGSGTTLQDFAGSNNGSLNGPSWVSNGQPFNCTICGESDRISVTAKIRSDITGVTTSLSCPGASGTTVVVNAIGGSGNYDYKELSGVVNYSGTYTPGEAKVTLPNGGVFDLVVRDEYNCLDTASNITTEPNPSPTNLAGSSASNTCLIPGENGWYYLVNASDQVILSINPNGENLGQVQTQLYVAAAAGVNKRETYMRRSFVITPEFQPTSPVGVRLFFSDADLNNLIDSSAATMDTDDDSVTIANLGVTKYQGPTEDGTLDASDATSLMYIPQSGNGTQFGQKYIEFMAPSFSEVWIHKTASADPLPVELVSFNAEYQQSKVRLDWATATEINAGYFIIERSDDSNGFKPIGQVVAAGNSDSKSEYQFIDEDPNLGDNYYRIKVLDLDGSVDYSPTRFVSFRQESAHGLAVFPNPNNGSFTLQIQEGRRFGSRVTFSIANPQGQEVYQAVWPSEIAEGFSFNFKLPTNLPKGLYILNVLGSQHQAALRFVLR